MAGGETSTLRLRVELRGLLWVHSHWLTTGAANSFIKTGSTLANGRLTQLPATTTPPHSTQKTPSGAHVFALGSSLALLPPLLGFSKLSGIPGKRGGGGEWRTGSLRGLVSVLFLD